MVFPVTVGSASAFGLWELAAVAAAAGLMMLFLPQSPEAFEPATEGGEKTDR